MIKNAIEQFLGSLSNERDFDVPFVSMLRTLGYFDIHCIHGAVEFGKDFVAKRQEDNVVYQYTLQTKFGDIGKTEFDEVRRQCDDMATSEIGHPSMDSALPKKMVVAFTGRFRGVATIMSQQYQQSLSSRKLPPVDYWSEERLLEYLTAEACLQNLDWRIVGKILQEIDVGVVGPFDLERVLRNFPLVENSGWKTILLFSIMAAYCRSGALRIHAFHLMLVCLRLIENNKLAGKIALAEAEEVESLILSNLAGYGKEITADFNAFAEDDRLNSLLNLTNPMDVFTGGSKLLLMSEMVAFYALVDELSEPDLSMVRNYFDTVLSIEAVSKPISDNYAISLLLIGCAAIKCGVGVDSWFDKIVAWLTTRYQGIGLAPSHSVPEQELLMALISPEDKNCFQFVENRRESLLAAALLDLSCICNLPSNYTIAKGAFVNSGIVPISTWPLSYPHSLFLGQGGIQSVSVDDYAVEWDSDKGNKQAQHHLARTSETLEEASIHVAVWLLTRDRWSFELELLVR